MMTCLDKIQSQINNRKLVKVLVCQFWDSVVFVGMWFYVHISGALFGVMPAKRTLVRQYFCAKPRTRLVLRT